MKNNLTKIRPKILKTDDYQEFENLLTSGGDERLELGKNGLNKYLTGLRPENNLIERSSCTASNIKKDEYFYSFNLYKKLKKGNIKFSEEMEDIHKRIRNIFKIENNHSIITIPSGTDSEYIPLWIAQYFFSDNKNVTNIICGSGEIGKDCPISASGLYHKKKLPSSRETKPNKILQGLSKPRLVEFPNRDEKTGRILNIFDDIITEIKNEIEKNDNFVILHILESSKLGHRYDEMNKIIDLANKYVNHLLIVVDACQSRTDINRIRNYLKIGCVVLITGSKFEQGPPFSGAVLIPHKIKISKNKKVKFPEGLKDFVTKYDVSGPIDFIKEQLPKRMNMGLMFRWNIGITNWEDYRKLNFNTRKFIVNSWVDKIIKLIKKYQNISLFSGGEYQPGSVGDVNSIFSLKLTHKNKFLNYNELKNVFYLMRKDMKNISSLSSCYNEKNFLKKKFLVGQPVSINNLNIIRIALGARMVNEIHNKGIEKVLKQDEDLLNKMNFLAKNYKTIKNTPKD
ncbi:MAG: hypothetical protein ACOC3Z_03560 [Nanoarchaeota archaeon]